jgi:hypothetical protein
MAWGTLVSASLESIPMLDLFLFFDMDRYSCGSMDKESTILKTCIVLFDMDYECCIIRRPARLAEKSCCS